LVNTSSGEFVDVHSEVVRYVTLAAISETRAYGIIASVVQDRISQFPTDLFNTVTSITTDQIV
jgi:hypothetical protein